MFDDKVITIIFNSVKGIFKLNVEALKADIKYLASEWDFYCRQIPDKSKAWEVGFILAGAYSRGFGIRFNYDDNTNLKSSIYSSLFCLVVAHVVTSPDSDYPHLKTLGLTDCESALQLSKSMLAITEAERIIREQRGE